MVNDKYKIWNWILTWLHDIYTTILQQLWLAKWMRQFICMSEGLLINVMSDYLGKNVESFRNRTSVRSLRWREIEEDRVAFCSAWFQFWCFFWLERLWFLQLQGLSVWFMDIMLCTLFVTLPFALQPMVSNVLWSHAGKCLTNVTCNCHLVVHFTEVGGNSLLVSTQFEAWGAEWFESHASRDARALESIAQVKVL